MNGCAAEQKKDKIYNINVFGKLLLSLSHTLHCIKFTIVQFFNFLEHIESQIRNKIISEEYTVNGLLVDLLCIRIIIYQNNNFLRLVRTLESRHPKCQRQEFIYFFVRMYVIKDETNNSIDNDDDE